MVKLNHNTLELIYRIHSSSMVTGYKVKYTDFQLENSNNIISGILYNQMLIDRDSCSVIVGYFYDVAPERMYKNSFGKPTYS